MIWRIEIRARGAAPGARVARDHRHVSCSIQYPPGSWAAPAEPLTGHHFRGLCLSALLFGYLAIKFVSRRRMALASPPQACAAWTLPSCPATRIELEDIVPDPSRRTFSGPPALWPGLRPFWGDVWVCGGAAAL